MQAPTGGWDTQQPLSDMDPDRAARLDNFIPRERYVELRRGVLRRSTGFPAPVQALMVWRGAGSEKFFAASGSAVYDITAGDAIGSAAADGFTSARWQYVNFATPGGHFIRCVNGEDTSLVYDGSAWGTTPAITGIDSANLIGTFVHKQRLYFVEVDSARFWYLAPVAIGGSAESYDLATIWSKGGHLVAGGTWTVDGGAGPDDLAVFVSSEGQVAVYQGIDPGAPDDWALVGVYDISRPIGRRCLVKLGGDLGILTEGGLLPLSSALQVGGGKDSRIAITSRINNAFQDAARLDRDNFGWEVSLYERGELLIVNVPLDEWTRSHQFVMNSTTGAWCRFTGLDAICWAVFEGNPYFGTEDSVFLADTGYLDDDEGIVADMLGAWTTMRRPGQVKAFTGIRPLLRTSVGATPMVAINTDFRESEPQSAPTIPQTSTARWGSARWGLDVWGENVVYRTDWSGAAGIGTYGAPRLRITTDAAAAVELQMLLDEDGDALLLEEDGDALLLVEAAEQEGASNVDLFHVIAFDIQYQPGGLM